MTAAIAKRAADRPRLDEAIVERALADSRSRARALILAGDVLVNGNVVHKAGVVVRPTDAIELRARPRFVSRGGEKLAHALHHCTIDVTGRVCADLGSSTGGFTDCLLQSGAARVYAVDVGYGQLDARLRDDARVVVLERTNARYLEKLPEPVSLVVVDVSFISLKLILPVAARLLGEDGWCVALIKPQFEAGRGEVGRGGVVKDARVWKRVIEETVSAAEQVELRLFDLTRSPLVGPAGNVEFLACFRLGGGDGGGQLADVASAIEKAIR